MFPGFHDNYRKVKGILPFSLAFLFFYLGWGFVAPIYSIKIKEWVGSYTMFGLIISLWGIVRFIVDAPVGVLCDKLNKKKILELSFLAYVLIGLAYTFAGNTPSVFGIRVLHSLFGSFLWVSSWAMIRESTPKGVEETNIGFHSAFISIAALLGPIIGGFVITLVSWEASFYLLSASCFISFLIIRSSKVEEFAKADGSIFDILRKSFHDFMSFGKQSSNLVIVTIIFFSIASFMSSFAPVFMEERGLSLVQIGFVVGIGINLSYILFSLPVGVMADKYGRGKALVAGLAISIIGLSLFALSQDFPSILLSIFVIYTGFSFISPTIDAVVDDMLIPGQAGGFAGITETFKDFGMILGPFIGGAVTGIIGVENLLLASSALFFLVIIFLAGDWRKKTGLFCSKKI